MKKKLTKRHLAQQDRMLQAAEKSEEVEEMREAAARG